MFSVYFNVSFPPYFEHFGNSRFDTVYKIYIHWILESYTTQKTACAKLSCQADQLPDRIDKLSLNLRGATKTIKNLWREIALNDASELKKSEEKLLKIHRKHIKFDDKSMTLNLRNSDNLDDTFNIDEEAFHEETKEMSHVTCIATESRDTK